MAECTPLIGDEAMFVVTPVVSVRGKLRSICCTVPAVVIVSSLLVIFGGIGLAIWFTNHSGVLSRDASLRIESPQPILPGDCVEITYHLDQGSLYSTYNMEFSLHHTVTDNNSSPLLYVPESDSLHISYESFHDSEPTKHVTNFSSCYNQTYFFDCFVYIAAHTNDSRIVYNITNYNYSSTEYQTKFEILVFDSSGNESILLKTVAMDTNNFIFAFNGTEIIKTSYLDFAIHQVVSRGSDPPSIIHFSISASGTVPSYNTTTISPYCTIEYNNTCQVETTTIDSKMYMLACLHNDSNDLLQLPEAEEVLSIIIITAKGPFTSIIGYCILFIPYAIVFVIFIALTCVMFCWCNIKKQRKRQNDTHFISSFSFAESVTASDRIQDSKELCADRNPVLDHSCAIQETPEKHPQKLLEINCFTASKDEGYFPDSAVIENETLSDSNCEEEDNGQFYITPDETLDDVTTPTPTVTTDETQVVDECDHTNSLNKENITKVTFNEKGLCHYFKHCGIAVVICKGAVTGTATLELGVSLLFPGYSCEGGRHVPVSPFIWIQVSKQLSSPACVCIPHGIDASDDGVKLVLLVKGHEDNAVFKVRRDVTFRLSKCVACIEMTHFCTLCLAVDENGDLPKPEYHVTVFERLFADHRKEIHVCILNNFMCFDKMKLEESYKKNGFTQLIGLAPIKRHQRCMKSEEDKEAEFTLSTDLSSDDWMLTQVQKSITKITESDIDVFKLLKCQPNSVTEDHKRRLESYQNQGTYPPRFRYMFYPKTEGKMKWQPVTLTLSGTEPYEEFSFNVLLGGSQAEQPVISPTIPTPDNHVEPLIVDVLPHIEPIFTAEPDKCMGFGHSLGLSVDILAKIQFKYSDNPKQCLFHSLLEWIWNNPDTFSYKGVSEALLQCGYPVMSVLISMKFVERQDNNASISHSPPDDYIVIEGPTVLKSSINGYEIIKDKLRRLPNGHQVLSCEPSDCDLNRIIYPCIGAKWKEFGTELKIQRSRLEIIERNRKGFCQDCFNDMVQMWRDSDSSPCTWDTVVKALYSPAIKGYATGEEVYMHLLHNYSSNIAGIVDN